MSTKSQTPDPTPTPSTGLLEADTLLNLSLGTLQVLSAGIKNKQVKTGLEIGEEVLPLIDAAIENLLKVKGQPVTFGQLEGLRFTPQW